MLTSFPRLGLGLLIAAATLLAAPNAHAVDVVEPTVVAQYAHDTEAFTQGLLFHDGVLYESTGLWGQSSLRELELETGEIQRIHYLSSDDFGEGLARVGDTLWQLTWQNGIAYRYALDDFSLLETAEYTGEGWGLCFDGERLVMSDGSSTLSFRDPETFELIGMVEVTADDAPLANLNELECIGDRVYANVWYEDYIAEIDPSSGEVIAQINAEGLLTDRDAVGADVLNGIAYNPETGHLYITGKDWPWLFELEVDGLDIPEDDDDGTSTGDYETSGDDTSTSGAPDETSTGPDSETPTSGAPDLPDSSGGEEPATSSSTDTPNQTNAGSGGCSVDNTDTSSRIIGLALLVLFGTRRRRHRRGVSQR